MKDEFEKYRRDWKISQRTMADRLGVNRMTYLHWID